jgi:hypothetical protein
MNNSAYSIGVVTYHARYDAYFKPLIEKLAAIFPDREILCVVNGHPDRTLQIAYLNKVTKFLEQFPNVRYLTYDQHQSLAKCWNQLVILSSNEKTLIMNDDTQVTELFRQEFETKALPKEHTTINSSWSHFLISKATVRRVGWFDERLLGVGYEDTDYTLRLAIIDPHIVDTTCLGLSNFVVNQDGAGWANISKKAGASKYSEINVEFFRTKWWHSLLDIEHKNWKYHFDWNGKVTRFSPKTNEPTPMFYEFSVLDNSGPAVLPHNAVAAHKNSGIVFFQKIYFSLRAGAKKIYQAIFY